jgi:diguanylate cyclase
MDSPLPRPQESKRLHWIVRTNYTYRTASFFLIFIGVGMHVYSKGASATLWTLLALQFLVSPHLLYLRVKRSADPQQAELNNLLCDAFLIGMWVSVLHFPLWPTFSMWMGCTLNVTINKGWKGMLPALLLFLTGAIIATAVVGFRFEPDTAWPVTALSFLGTATYLIATGNASNVRANQLRSTREKLRLGEQALHANNDLLQQQLAEIQILQDKLKEQAVRDPMTGLFNRRYLDTILPHELARCARDGVPLCLMMMDIDHFKHVNDSHGHQGGDEVLKACASLLIDSVRASDVACRYGGEEFLLLLPNMAEENAVIRAEQWRAAFAATSVEFGGMAIRATVSIGIACYPEDGCTSEVLIRCADLALYRAKAEGRNRAVVFTTHMAPVG